MRPGGHVGRGVAVLVFLAMLAGQSLAADRIRVGFVVPSTVDDLSWSQAMHEGLKALQNEYGKDRFELSVSERLGNPVDAAAAVRQYATQGYDLIIAHGAQYQSLLDDVAPDFPRTTFAYGTGFAASHPNVFAYDPHAQEGAYLMGIVAGLLTKTKVIGLVGPVEAGDAVKFNRWFEKGVLSVRPDAKVRIAYTGSFNDLVGAGEIARTHIKAGADFLAGTAQQSVGALKEVSQHKGVYWMGNDLNAKHIAPQSLMATQVYDFKGVVKEMLELRAKQTLGGRTLALTLASGTISVVFNLPVPADVMERFEKEKARIVSGSLKLESAPGAK